LNVGPRPDGQIEADQVQRLHEIGGWLAKYGQSIYATRGGPYLPGDFGVSTYRDKTIYIHLLKPNVTSVVLPALPAKVLKAECLTGGDVTFNQTDGGLQLMLSGNSPVVDIIVALTLDASAAGITPIGRK
jgi:alpha-L-fucosidase